MTSLADRILEASKGTPERIVEVPEWPDDDGNPTMIYVAPLTLKTLARIRKKAGDDDIQNIIYTLIYCAMDENGDPLFTIADKAKLLATDVSIICDVVARMNEKDIDPDDLGN